MYYDFWQDVVAKLKEVGHEIADYGDVGSIITAIEVTPDGKIHARCALETSFSPAMVHKGVYCCCWYKTFLFSSSDPRKAGGVDGFWKYFSEKKKMKKKFAAFKKPIPTFRHCVQ